MTTNQISDSYKTPSVEIFYFPSSSIIQYQWVGLLKDEDGKTGMLKVLEFIIKYHANSIIADLGSFKGASVEFVSWINDTWANYAHSAGLKNIAIVTPDHSYGEFSKRLVMGKNISSLFTIDKFPTLVSATKWINDLDQS